MSTGKLIIAAIATAGIVCFLIWIQGGFDSKVPGGTTPIPGGAGGPAKTVKAEVSRMVGEVTVSGTVIARDTATVAARVVGHVTQLDVDAGTRVAKGEVLLRLETKELVEREAQAAAALASAKADRDKAAGDFDRYKALLESQSIAQKEFDDVKARHETAKAAEDRAKAALDEAKTQLSYAEVTAPFDGIVGAREVNVGDLATPGKPLLSVYKPGTLELVAAVGEQYGPYLAPGIPVALTVDSLALKQASSIREVVPQSDVKTRTITVKAPLTEHAGLGPGLYGTLTFHSKASEAVTVPTDAIQRIGQLESVTIVEGGFMKIRHVKTGRTLGDGRVEILSGLRPGEEVVVK
jgi:RND family efflux transporter MFP subunit